MKSTYFARFLLVFALSTSFSFAQAQLQIQDLGKEYPLDENRLKKGLYFQVPSDLVNHGNTSIRNEAAESLVWKGSPDSNGFGYFQRNRDMGQVFNVPEGEDVKLDALVLRSSKGENALMEGVAGAELYVVFFEVKAKANQQLRINENGTSKGEEATHGFDVQFNRCDDFIEGDEYVFLHLASGGVFPSIPHTTQPVYKREGRPNGEQEGHLRYFRFDLLGDSEITLEAGKRYAFMVGFSEPGKDRGIAWSIRTEVHTKEKAAFVTDENGLVRWGIRREGDGTLPPTMMQAANPPPDPTAYQKLVKESLFPANHFATLSPTSDGYPDVDTYRTMEFYLEVKE